MHLALIKYSVLRLALFVGSLLLLSVLGVHKSIGMLVLAAVMSLALSYLLLRGQRDALAQALAERTRSRLDHRQGIGRSDADAEDAAVEASERLDTRRSGSQHQPDSQHRLDSQRQSDGQ